MRTNHVLIDFENVQPESLVQLAQDHFNVLVFVGANQAKLPFEFAAAMQKLGSRAEYIKIEGNGSNALDFHIAYYIGRLACEDPTAYFHIVSKDAGFDPLISHLKTKKVFAGRVKAISEIPLIKASVTKLPDERLGMVLGKLQQLKASKPRTLKTLGSTISSLFQKQIGDEEIAVLVALLGERGYLTAVEGKVTYTLPSDV